jgi:hypothetical protein
LGVIYFIEGIVKYIVVEGGSCPSNGEIKYFIKDIVESNKIKTN